MRFGTSRLHVLGGAWIFLDLMSSEVLTIARMLPGFWYAEACQAAAHLPAGAPFGSVLPVLQDIGVLALFAVALFCVALVAARLRVRTAASGGNRAAASTVA